MKTYGLVRGGTILFLATAMTGCGTSSPSGRETERAANSGPSSRAAAYQEPGTRAERVELEVVQTEPLVEKIKTHKNKIVVVDTWSTTCIPCMKEFPGLVELHRKYQKDGVVCISVSMDKVKDQAKALDFLQKQHAAFPNYLVEQENEEWWTKWNLQTIPAILVFDRDGKLVRKFVDEDAMNRPTYEGPKGVTKFVESLLGPQ